MSDFLSERSDAGLATLAAHGPQVVAIQVLDTGEIDPDLREGDVRMVDSESGSMLELAVRDDVLQRYREELDRFQRELRESLASFGNHFVPLRSDASLRSVFLHDFVREGLLR